MPDRCVVLKVIYFCQYRFEPGIMRVTFHLMALLVISTALAGCQHEGNDTASRNDDARPIGEAGVGTASNGIGGGEGPTEEAPRGEIGRGDVAQLAHAFGDDPFDGGQKAPRSHWKWITENTFIGIVLDQDIQAEPARVLWAVIGEKGVFCSEVQPRDFPYFQQVNASSWEEGKGGQGGEQGYWLQSIAVSQEVADGETSSGALGLDAAYGVTPPPSCDQVPSSDFFVPEQHNLTGQGVAMLIDAFDDQPFWGDQASPGYVSKWVSADTFLFLLFDHPDPQEAKQVDWLGVGVRGRACEDVRPAEEFMHFHKWQADSFEAGHHAQAGAYGYWMLHAATHPLAGPDDGGPEWGPVPTGWDRAFMPTAIDGAC